MKLKEIQILILSLLCLHGAIFGHNVTSPNPVKPLPTLKVTSLNQRDGQMYMDREYVNPATEEIIGQTKFSFPNLDIRIDDVKEANMTSMPIADDQEFGSFMVALNKADATRKVKKIDTLVDKALKIGNYIDKLTGGDLVTMPIVKKQTFGNTDIYIVFQSAKIYPTYAELEVYIKIDMKKKDFNGKDAILYFGAKSIKFSQDKGIIEGNVGLAADYAIKLGDSQDKAGLYLKAMSTLPNGDDVGTYVKFDCDGFKEMGVGGALFFSRDWLIPTDEFGVPRGPNPKDLSNTPRVNAHFQFVAQDFNDFFINLSIDHFTLAKWDKMSFYLGNANLDLSSYRNPIGIPYPHVNDIGNLWEGVYIKSVSITMPEPFKRNKSSFAGGGNANSPPETERIKVSADHLLIDEFGVFGDFSIVGQAPLIGGPIMDGEWGWSLDSIGISLKASNIDAFGFGGGLGVPILSKKGPLAYEGSYEKSTNRYSFDVEQQVKKSFPIWNAAVVDIHSVGIEVAVEDGEFKPAVSFSGSLNIGDPKDYGKDQKGSPVKMPGLSFTELKLQTKSPIISAHTITLNTGGSKVVGFPVTVSAPTMTPLPNDELSLGFNLIINLMNEGAGVSATGAFALHGKYTRDENGSRHWEYKSLNFTGATVVVSLPQFYGTGSLCLFEKHPTYGDGFSATLGIKIIGEDLHEKNGKFNLNMNAIFGSTPGYRYWMVDGFLKSEKLTVPIVPGVVELNGFGGGAFHHMKPGRYDASLQGGNNQSCSNLAADYCGIVYEPNASTKLGLKFSTSFTAKGGLLTGLLTCILRFGNNYALQNITFWGTADLMIPADLTEKVLGKVENAIPDNVLNQETLTQQNKDAIKAKSGVTAAVGISLDFEESFAFHAFAEVKLDVGGVIKGSGALDILVDPGGNPENENPIWHFYLGGYYDNSVTVPGFFSDEPMAIGPVSVGINYGDFTVEANAYFLTGNDLPGPPPPHPQVVAFFGPEGESNNRGALNSCPGRSAAKGTGIAFGASAFINFDNLKKGIFGSCVAGWKVGIGGGLGFDLALLKYNRNDVCEKSEGPVGGINGLRATGRVYAFIEVESGHVTCIPLPHLGIGAKLRFDINKPTFFQGIFIIDFIQKIGVKGAFGTECGTVCSGDPILE